MPVGERGFTFAAVLVLLALSTLGLSMAGPMWSQQVQRERERDLVRIGGLYARAITSYRAASPGSAKHYPVQLDELARDARYVGTMRHLRRLYPDPMLPGQPWAVVRNPDGRIIGVHSNSQAQPLGQGIIDDRGRPLPAVRRYAEWQFLAEDGT